MKVRNLRTGLVHEVPDGHPALDDGLHELVVEVPPKPEPAPEATPEPIPAEAPPKRTRATARRGRK